MFKQCNLFPAVRWWICSEILLRVKLHPGVGTSFKYCTSIVSLRLLRPLTSTCITHTNIKSVSCLPDCYAASTVLYVLTGHHMDFCRHHTTAGMSLAACQHIHFTSHMYVGGCSRVILPRFDEYLCTTRAIYWHGSDNSHHRKRCAFGLGHAEYQQWKTQAYAV